MDCFERPYLLLVLKHSYIRQYIYWKTQKVNDIQYFYKFTIYAPLSMLSYKFKKFTEPTINICILYYCLIVHMQFVKLSKSNISIWHVFIMRVDM